MAASTRAADVVLGREVERHAKRVLALAKLVSGEVQEMARTPDLAQRMAEAGDWPALEVAMEHLRELRTARAECEAIRAAWLRAREAAT